jgi:hypothetical protein
VESLSKRKPKESELTILGGILTYSMSYAGLNFIKNTFLANIFCGAQKTPLFNIILEDLDDGIGLVRRGNRLYHIAALLIRAGRATHHYDQREQKNTESTLSFRAECVSLNASHPGFGVQHLWQKRCRNSNVHHFKPGQGQRYLADILKYSGDYLTSLSAWSIIPRDIDFSAIALVQTNDERHEPMKSTAQDVDCQIFEQDPMTEPQLSTWKL